MRTCWWCLLPPCRPCLDSDEHVWHNIEGDDVISKKSTAPSDVPCDVPSDAWLWAMTVPTDSAWSRWWGVRVIKGWSWKTSTVEINFFLVCMQHFFGSEKWDCIILFLFIFHNPPSSGIAAGMVTWGRHLTQPYCVALGQVLIWVVSPDWFEEHSYL